MPLYPGGGTQNPAASIITTTSSLITSADIPYILTPDGFIMPSLRAKGKFFSGNINAASTATLVAAVANKQWVVTDLIISKLAAGLVAVVDAVSGSIFEFYLAASAPIVIKLNPHVLLPSGDNVALLIRNDSAAADTFRCSAYGWYYNNSTNVLETF